MLWNWFMEGKNLFLVKVAGRLALNGSAAVCRVVRGVGIWVKTVGNFKFAVNEHVEVI